MRADLAKRSIAARVVSSETAMLVLESDADYDRYHIPRNALADILVVDDHGVALAHRAAPVMIAAPAVADAAPRHKSKTAMREDDAKKPADSLALTRQPEAKAAAGEADDGDGKDDAAEDAVSRGGKESVAQGARGGDAPGRPMGGATGGMGNAGSASAPPPPPAPPRSAAPSPEPAASNGTFADADKNAELADPSPRERDRRQVARPAMVMDEERPRPEAWEPNKIPALTGDLAQITGDRAAGRGGAALDHAWAWRERSPGDVLALIALGEATEARGDKLTAARAYGSIIDLYPARADFRRFAGERLARLGATTTDLQLDTLKRAVEERPDHLSGHRLYAYALVRAGRYAEAFDAILAGFDQPYPDGRFAGGMRVLAEDAAMIGTTYLAHAPAKRAEVTAALGKRSLALATTASTRFVLYWETDDNDVDFHIQDARGNHAYYAAPTLASGGSLYADITTGYGPECFTIEGTPRGGPYHLSINYFSQGPMGYGMGLLEAQRFDGKGGLTFEDRPYVIMTNQAFVDLGTYK
jgi:tetratricopeptide (TPR) repeat protein